MKPTCLVHSEENFENTLLFFFLVAEKEKQRTHNPAKVKHFKISLIQWGRYTWPGVSF